MTKAKYVCAALGAFAALTTTTASAAITVVPVNGTQTTVVALGGDTMGFFNVNYFQSSIPAVNSVRINSNEAYWQAADVIVGAPQYTTFSGTQIVTGFRGVEIGLNFAAFDLDQNNVVDSVFYLDLGPDLTVPANFRLISYAYDDSGSAIDLNEARTLLIAAVPEPTSSLMVGLGMLGCATLRRRR